MGSASQANIRITSLKKTLATTLSPRVLLPAINKTYKQIEKNWKVRSYWVLDFGEGRCGPEISKFSLKEEDGYLIDKRTNELGMFKLACLFTVLLVEAHASIYEHLARAHWGHEEGRAHLPSGSTNRVFSGSPGLPSTAL